MWWPRLKVKFEEIMDAQETQEEDAPLRKDRDILEEILEISRLNFRRRSRSLEIVPQAVSNLIQALIEAVKAIQGETDHQTALNALRGMCEPIQHIARRTRSNEEINPREMALELEELIFEYQSPDDEMPF